MPVLSVKEMLNVDSLKQDGISEDQYTLLHAAFADASCETLIDYTKKNAK